MTPRSSERRQNRSRQGEGLGLPGRRRAGSGPRTQPRRHPVARHRQVRQHAGQLRRDGPGRPGLHRHRLCDSSRRRSAQLRLSRRPSSSISTDGACMPTNRGLGITDASATWSPSTPRTRSCGSTTLARRCPCRRCPSWWYRCEQAASANREWPLCPASRCCAVARWTQGSLSGGPARLGARYPQARHHGGPV